MRLDDPWLTHSKTTQRSIETAIWPQFFLRLRRAKRGFALGNVSHTPESAALTVTIIPVSLKRDGRCPLPGDCHDGPLHVCSLSPLFPHPIGHPSLMGPLLPSGVATPGHARGRVVSSPGWRWAAAAPTVTDVTDVKRPLHPRRYLRCPVRPSRPTTPTSPGIHHTKFELHTAVARHHFNLSMNLSSCLSCQWGKQTLLCHSPHSVLVNPSQCLKSRGFAPLSRALVGRGGARDVLGWTAVA